MKKVGIIVGSGFIESDIIALFLDHHFDVKVSTTDIKNKAMYQHLMHLNNADHLHICELDHHNKLAVEQFVKDCDFIVQSNKILD